MSNKNEEERKGGVKIMQILPRLWSGGVEKGVLDLVLFFKDKSPTSLKEKINNIVVSGGGQLVAQLEKEGITHYTVDVYRKSPLTLFSLPKVKRIIENEGVDIVHARSRVPAWVSFFASRGRCHFITTAHGVYKNRFWSQVMGWGKFVICPSQVVAQYMHKNFDLPLEKLVIIYRWVDLEKIKFISFSQRKKSNVILGIGRISPSKGYEYLIEGFRKISRLNPYFTLKIVGCPDKSGEKYFQSLKTLVKRFALNYQVQFLGYRSDIEDILKDARLLVVPSVIEESFGRVIIEAFAAGVPVIASDLGAFKEIIEDNHNGILVEAKNSQAITSAMLKILGDNALAERLAKNAHEKVKSLCSLENCLKQNEEVYRQTLNILRILVIKISSLGDLILAIPTLTAIKKQFPQAKVSLLTLEKYSSFFDGCPYLDEVITLEKGYKKITNILRIANYLRRYSFDYIVDLQNSRASHFITYLSLPYKSFGYSLRLGFLLTKRASYNFKDDPLTSQERILSLFGTKLKEKRLTFWEVKDKIKDIPQTLGFAHENIIGINVCASLKWKSKNWPQQHLAELIQLIYKEFPTYRIMLLGDEDAQKDAQDLENYFHPALSSDPIRFPRKGGVHCAADQIPHPAGQQLMNYCGKIHLKDLPALISKLKVLITPDTATMHLGYALGIPTVALFGPTDPCRHTVRDKNLYIFCKELPCSFCYRPKCKIKEKNLCMEKITPPEVLAKIKEIIK